jgi:hypothetical protein
MDVYFTEGKHNMDLVASFRLVLFTATLSCTITETNYNLLQI